jgi:hypothetical protein
VYSASHLHQLRVLLQLRGVSSEWAWFEPTREPVSPAATLSAGSHLEHSSHDRHTHRATRERCVGACPSRAAAASAGSASSSPPPLCRHPHSSDMTSLWRRAIAPLKQFLVDAASLRPPTQRTLFRFLSTVDCDQWELFTDSPLPRYKSTRQVHPAPALSNVSSTPLV